MRVDMRGTVVAIGKLPVAELLISKRSACGKPRRWWFRWWPTTRARLPLLAIACYAAGLLDKGACASKLGLTLLRRFTLLLPAQRGIMNAHTPRTGQ